jgi:hypothetical protein
MGGGIKENNEEGELNYDMLVLCNIFEDRMP